MSGEIRPPLSLTAPRRATVVSQHRSWISRMAELVRDYSFLPVMHLCPGTANFEADESFWNDLLAHEAADANVVIVQGRKLLLGLARFVSRQTPQMQRTFLGLFIALVDKSTSVFVELLQLGIVVATPATINNEVAKISSAEETMMKIPKGSSAIDGTMLGIPASQIGTVHHTMNSVWTESFGGNFVTTAQHGEAEIVVVCIEEKDDVSDKVVVENLVKIIEKWRWHYGRTVLLAIHDSKNMESDLFLTLFKAGIQDCVLLPSHSPYLIQKLQLLRQHLRLRGQTEFDFTGDRDGDTSPRNRMGRSSFGLGVNRPQTSIHDFELISVIGQGSYGKILLAKHTESEQIFALKVILKEKMAMLDNPEYVLNERICLEKVNCDFVVKMHWAFQDEHHLYFVMDYVGGGDLFALLEKERRLSEDTARFYAAEIFVALYHMHTLNVVYRDLKPENVMIALNGHIVLADLGLSTVLQKEENYRSHSICGTKEYVAPEVVLGKDHSFECDWWCFGILLYEMLVGKTPYHARDIYSYMERLAKREEVHFPAYVSPLAQDLISRLLQFDPQDRLGAKLPEDEFYVAEKCASAIIDHPFFDAIDFESILSKQIRPPYLPAKDQFDSAGDLSLLSRFQASSPSNKTPQSLQEIFNQFKPYSRQTSTDEKQAPVSNLNLGGLFSSDSPNGSPRRPKIRASHNSPSLTPNFRKDALLTMSEIFDFKNEILNSK